MSRPVGDVPAPTAGPELAPRRPTASASQTVAPGRFTASASLAVRDLVAGRDTEVAVLAAFPMAVYLTTRDPGPVRTIAIVTADGIAQPHALVLSVASDQRPLAGLHRGGRGVIGHGGLELAGRRIVARRWWDPAPRLRATSVERLRAAVTSITRALPAAARLPGELAGPLAELTAAAGTGDPRHARRHALRLLGRGAGLTPSGDDALAGFLAGVHRLGPALGLRADHRLPTTVTNVGGALVEVAADRTTAVSAALLGHAARGEVATPVARWLRAVTGGTDLEEATTELLAVGSSSGADLLAGLLAATTAVTDAVRPAVPARSPRSVPPDTPRPRRPHAGAA